MKIIFFLAKTHHAIIEFMADWNNCPVSIESNLFVNRLWDFLSIQFQDVPLKTS